MSTSKNIRIEESRDQELAASIQKILNLPSLTTKLTIDFDGGRPWVEVHCTYGLFCDDQTKAALETAFAKYKLVKIDDSEPQE